MNDADMVQAQQARQALGSARRVVVKVGSRVLVGASGRPDPARMKALVHELSALRRAGREVILVTSGAVGAGMEALGLKQRPTLLPDLQMAAAVGQARLMARYDKLFAARRCIAAQVLLTHDDLKHRRRHLNARNTIMNLLHHGIIPIINENDVVAVDEIKVGDNDTLAALVSILVEADVLVLLTRVNGLRAPAAGGRTRRVRFLPQITPEALGLAKGKTDGISTGGMGSKLLSVQTASSTGTAAVIANGRQNGVLASIFAGEDTGTLVGTPPIPRRDGPGARKRWIAYFHRTAGTIIIDDGAREALRVRGKSLLPIGVRSVIGEFPAGTAVAIQDEAGELVGRGLVDFSSQELRAIQGRKTSEIAPILGRSDYEEAIHRDNMVIFHPATENGAKP